MMSMRRFRVATWVMAATVWSASAGAGCEKAQRGKAQDPVPTKDARVVAHDTRLVSNDARPLDARDDGPEPTVPPPPPTVKAKGKGDCKVEYAPRPTRDPNPVCKIAGGTFMMGSDDPKAAANEKPVRKVTLTPYFIDQFEVTNAQVAHFLNAVGNECENGRAGMCFVTSPIFIGEFIIRPGFVHSTAGGYAAERGHEREPVNNASALGAERYCAWVGKRLPTEAEWEFAARHDPKTQQDYEWPWGDKFYPKRAECDEGVCKDGFNEHFDEDIFNSQAPVGTFDGTHGFNDGSSPWGVHDMAGNVSEIMADIIDFNSEGYPDCGTCIDPVILTTSNNATHVVRELINARSSGWSSVSPRRSWRGEGFRCAYR